MDWFSTLCRNAGLMIHHTVKPLSKKQTDQVQRTVEEKQIDPRVTLRRTTIDEIEVSPPDGSKRPGS